MKRRNRNDFEIAYKILSSLNEGEKTITNLGLYSRLSFNDLKPRLEQLCKFDYVKKYTPIKKHPSVKFIYTITQKGYELMNTIKELANVEVLIHK